MNANNPIMIRDYIILVFLSPCFGHLASTWENYEEIDDDTSWIGKGAPPDVIERSPEFAIRQTKFVQDEIWCCELLTSMISSSELKRSILTMLAMRHDAIGQSDVPAQSAILDDKSDEATRICSEAMGRAWECCGQELLQCMARCTAEARILFPNGCNHEDVMDVRPFN